MSVCIPVVRPYKKTGRDLITTGHFYFGETGHYYFALTQGGVSAEKLHKLQDVQQIILQPAP